MKCRSCKALAQVRLPSHNAGFCPSCYFEFFSRQVSKAIRHHKMFNRDERILVCLSGGKDSLALMYELARQGYNVTGLHVNLAIPGSSEVVLNVVEKFCQKHDFPLIVKNMEQEGLPIPEVKRRVRRPICSVCGKIKRHYFNLAGIEGKFDVLATGHNLDDEVARLFANALRWDVGYLGHQNPSLPAENGFIRKVKPLYRLTEFETANYAFLRGIDYHSAGCPYSPGASFTGHKMLMENLEHDRPGAKILFYDNFLKKARPVFAEAAHEERLGELVQCEECGMPSPVPTCGVCSLRARLAAPEE
ncbi:MAG: ATP-binding protein [Desulfovibrio sp.]|uniref:ATP-binding protein n=1 Tax=Desulfovibrio sp. 7SRBS1 TaxID=3378064 RepID=UPI003B3EAAD9